VEVMIVEVILLALLLLMVDDDDDKIVIGEDSDVGGNNVSVVNDNFIEDDKIIGDNINEGVNDGR